MFFLYPIQLGLSVLPLTPFRPMAHSLVGTRPTGRWRSSRLRSWCSPSASSSLPPLPSAMATWQQHTQAHLGRTAGDWSSASTAPRPPHVAPIRLSLPAAGGRHPRPSSLLHRCVAVHGPMPSSAVQPHRSDRGILPSPRAYAVVSAFFREVGATRLVKRVGLKLEIWNRIERWFICDYVYNY